MLFARGRMLMMADLCRSEVAYGSRYTGLLGLHGAEIRNNERYHKERFWFSPQQAWVACEQGQRELELRGLK
ncbi:hypothetical protein L484_004305 [Morus notabilis]|uniref:Uncharacterized protein n=1 Tax=Morus notabilis TaxID=981085 RepID=W9RGB6_9ROSA|nr:hypothetical protein L484_004305 [Morus notabilis]